MRNIISSPELRLTLVVPADIVFTGGREEIGGDLVHKLSDGSQREGVLDVGIGESHVFADHQSDGEVGGAPGGREEGSGCGPQTLGLAQDGKVRELQVEGTSQGF